MNSSSTRGAANEIYQLVDLYDRPLLLCNPTLAVLAEEKGKQYRLLDRDTRFNFLSRYRQFSLTKPHFMTDYEFDSVFIDPPFANVTPKQTADCLQRISADKAPLYVAYNSRREEALLEAMNGLDCPTLERKWSLDYKDGVSHSTQDSIWLYGPANVERGSSYGKEFILQ
jgi:EEF1A lysine methyltransferase 1